MGTTFLDIKQIVRIHHSVIEHYGGLDGIRDIGMLHSAVAMPQAGFGGQMLHESLFEMAAAYLYHIVQNHPFLDGNKRAGAAAAIVFLSLNGVSIDADEEGLVKLTLAAAQGEIGKAAIAEFFQTRAR